MEQRKEDYSFFKDSGTDDKKRLKLFFDDSGTTNKRINTFF